MFINGKDLLNTHPAVSSTWSSYTIPATERTYDIYSFELRFGSQLVSQIYIDNSGMQSRNIPRTMFGYVDDTSHYGLLGLSCAEAWKIDYRFLTQVNNTQMYFGIKVYV